MKTLVVFPLRLCIFWLAFFALFRLWFVLWFRQEWSHDAPMLVWSAFWHALPLDCSMAGYLLVVPVLLWAIGIAVGLPAYYFAEQVIFFFNLLIIIVLIGVFGANVFIYKEWHTLLNNRALEYIKTPSALFDSMSGPFVLGALLLYAGAIWVVYRGYLFVVGRKVFRVSSRLWALPALPLWLGLLALAIRGGIGVMPINESAVYYSPHIFDNHAATNTAWHLAHCKLEARSTEHRYRYMTDQEAKWPVYQLFGNTVPDSSRPMRFFSTPDTAQLNVVFIIMESMTAQVVASLHGEKDVCPNLEKLIQQGILFSNCYGSGYRTDQGIVSVLAGYPAQPDQSIILLEDKAAKLQSLSKTLQQVGYSTAFFYGGELTFANIGSWLSQQQFEKIISEKDFSGHEITQRWGVDDEKLLQRAVLEINQLRQPFFAAAMTLSLHPPYDVPYTSQWQGNADREKFLNSAAFADHAVGAFFESARQQPWYDQTLFVLVADHGSSQPGGVGQDNPVSRHIPLIMFGKPLLPQWQGKKIDMFCNHHDIPDTVKRMLGVEVPGSDILWSRNLWWWYDLFDRYKGTPTAKFKNGFACFTNENGLGWVNNQGKGFYYFNENRWHFWEGSLDAASQQEAKAYLQKFYQDFLDK
jgi:phosphoglycerol transferase MdoB-like AlkP superfamily enzyme